MNDNILSMVDEAMSSNDLVFLNRVNKAVVDECKKHYLCIECPLDLNEGKRCFGGLFYERYEHIEKVISDIGGYHEY